jgi:hypothetical protein
MEHDMNVVRKQTAAIEKLSETLSLASEAEENMQKGLQGAKTAVANHKTLIGLRKWKPIVLCESAMQFEFVGNLPNSCMRVTFEMLPARVSCAAVVDAKAFSKRGTKRRIGHSKLVARFVDGQTAQICTMINNTSLSSASEMSQYLRHIDVLLGRLHYTAMELAKVQRRYEVQLGPVSSPLYFILNFASSSNDSKFSTKFELNLGYPYCPLTSWFVENTKDIDTELLERMLIKNAQPGFGYLSRTCDILAAIVK